VAGGAEPRRVIVTHRAGLPRIRGGTQRGLGLREG
jgi:hypothetical protein